MPIYDQGYRRYEARGPLAKLRFWPITREALRLVLAKRAFIGLMILAGLPFLYRAVILLATVSFPGVPVDRLLGSGASLFGTFLSFQIIFAILISIFGGAGLVANDLRTGAILVYLSRPLTRRDYVLGKLGVLMALNSLVTVVPGLVLYFIAISLQPDRYRTLELWWVAPAIVVQGLLISLTVSLISLAVSSMSKSARLAGLGFAMLFVGLEITRTILRALTRSREVALLSPQANLRAIGSALFGNTERGIPEGVLFPALVLATIALACLLILRTRVRAVEVVS